MKAMNANELARSMRTTLLHPDPDPKEYIVVREHTSGMLRIFSPGMWRWISRDFGDRYTVVATDPDLKAMQRIVDMVNKGMDE